MSDVESDPSATFYTHGGGTFAWTTDVAHSGSGSLRADSSAVDSSSLARWMTRTDAIRVSPGLATVTSAWLRTASVAGGFAAIAVTYWTASSAYIGGSATTSGLITGTSDWQRLSAITTAPPGAATMRVEFRLYGAGTLWADDVAVSPAS